MKNRYSHATLGYMINDYRYCLPTYLEGVSPKDFSDHDIEVFLEEVQLIQGDKLSFDFSNPPSP